MRRVIFIVHVVSIHMLALTRHRIKASAADPAAAAARLNEAATALCVAETQLPQPSNLHLAKTKLMEAAEKLAAGDDRSEAELLAEEVVDVSTRVAALTGTNGVQGLAEEAEDIRLRVSTQATRLAT